VRQAGRFRGEIFATVLEPSIGVRRWPGMIGWRALRDVGTPGVHEAKISKNGCSDGLLLQGHQDDE
jgi:hypothetical protein